MDKDLNTLLADLRNYKDRLSVALKIADISIFEVDLKQQMFTYFDNSESIFDINGCVIMSEVNRYSGLPWNEYLTAVSAYFTHPEDTQFMEDAFRCIMTGRAISFEARLKAGHRECKWCKVDVAPVMED